MHSTQCSMLDTQGHAAVEKDLLQHNDAVPLRVAPGLPSKK